MIHLHARLGWKVVLTDKDPLPQQMARNAQTNFPQTYGTRIQAHELDWSREGVQHLVATVQSSSFWTTREEQEDTPNNSHSNTKTGGGFDFVINCDCVYEPLYGLSWKLLVETMDELLRINPKTVVLTCLERRKADGVDQFLKALETSHHVSQVERIRYDSEFGEEVQLYRIHGLPLGWIPS